MTIIEVESRTGMTRANIRFYEAEGLLSPARGANGYRDYSQEDIEILRRIKLLRTLRMPLEEIKELHRGEKELSAALEARLEALSAEAEEIELSRELCRTIQSDGASYDTLDAERYLDMLTKENQNAVDGLKKDVMPRVRAFWRRYFARMTDFAIYDLILEAVAVLALGVNTRNMGVMGSIVMAVLAMVLMLGIEPLLLHFFGTTPGKAVFGFYVTDPGGEKLGISAGFNRTVGVLRRGMGFQIPIYSLYRLYRSAADCDEGSALEWEQDSVMTEKERKWWRIPAFLGANAAIIGVSVLIVLAGMLPVNRGDITVAEFCENYNAYIDYFDLDMRYRLDRNGFWVDTYEGKNIIVVGGSQEQPELKFEVENGYMTGLSFESCTTSNEIWPSSMTLQMQLFAMSFVRAQTGQGIFETLVTSHDAILEAFEEDYNDVKLSLMGVDVKCDFEYSGYHDTGHTLIPDENREQSFYMSFTMEK